MANILETKDLVYAYTENHKVLDNINLKFESGKIYVVLGVSGSGKTTLLSLLGGLDIPQSGEILFDGMDIQSIGLNKYRRNCISFVFQNYNLIEYMTPIENVQLTANTSPIEILEKVGLTKEEMKRNVLKLSGGQQQRVAIARALASDAAVILADEPTGNLDEDTAAEIIDLFINAAKSLDKCIIIVSHSSEVAALADTVLRFENGSIKIEYDE